MIVLTGATGHVGGEATRILRESGLGVRVVVRDPERAGCFPGSSVAVADHTDPDRLAAALAPGDRVFMVPVDSGHEDRMAGHRSFVAAAAAADVGQLVYLSFLGAAPEAVFAHAVSHAETEELVRTAGVPFTFLRMGLYQASVPFFFTNGECVAPAGHGRASWVSRRDVGTAVAAVLRSPGHLGATYDLTGPEALDMAGTTERVNRLLGLDLRYRDADDPGRLPLRGLPDRVALAASRRSCFLAMAAGQLAAVSDDLGRLTGVAPAPLDRHVLTYPEQFRPAGAHVG